MKDKNADSKLHFEELKYFAAVWSMYHNSKPAITVTEAAKAVYIKSGLGPKSHPGRWLTKAARKLGYPEFEAAIRTCSKSRVETIERLCRTIDCFGRDSGDGVKIRFGFGHSLSLSIAPRILSSFRAKYPHVKIQCVVEDGEHILNLLKSHQLDVALTALNPSIPTEPIEAVRLDAALIAHTKHEVSRAYRQTSTPRSRTEIVEAIRSTKPRFGQRHVVHILDKNTAFRSQAELLNGDQDLDVEYFIQGNYAAINELVAVGTDLGITIPHFLTEYQRARVQIMSLNLPVDERPQLVCLKETDEVQIELYEAQMPRYTEIAQGLVDCIREGIRKLKADETVEPIEEKFKCYIQFPHVGMYPWFAGSFWMFSRRENRFTGELELTEVAHESEFESLQPDQRMLFSILGREERLAETNLRFVTIQGTVEDRDGKTSETFVGGFMRRDDSREYIGEWLGREGAEPSSGYLVICPDGTRLTHAQLNAKASEYRQARDSLINPGR